MYTNLTDKLADFYDDWRALNNLPGWSADELRLKPYITRDQENFLDAFIDLWEIAQHIEDDDPEKVAEKEQKKINDYFIGRGFKIIGTGGGCEAWHQFRGDPKENIYAMITELDDPSLPATDKEIMIGLYHDEELIGSTEGTLSDVMLYWEYQAGIDADEYLNKETLLRINSLKSDLHYIQNAIDALIDAEPIVGGPVVAPVIAQLRARESSRAEEIDKLNRSI
jgi:hypothetical protein